MKRYIETNGRIRLTGFESDDWEVLIRIEKEDLITFFMELQLLEFNHAECFTTKSLVTGKNINFMLVDMDEETRVELINDRIKVKLSHNDIGYISSFLLEYYRDSYAPASHIHIDVDNNSNIGKSGTITIEVSEYAPPMSGEEAKKILGIE
ncbi:hypothetical protein IAI10_06170 [Clostridium sp. 19966]|uniref:hypothetical protein n=1 Tax=Clostridium sp. 19966 TaxID=2768166 RepID=UPI0028DE9117|nr:hypothetical protein [Clostridium sp. 19966]MDT8716236.1 hypothetical protein [Clostridium sp. 19966]